MTLHVEKCCVDGQQGQVRRSLPGGEDTSEPLPQVWLPLLEGTSLFLDRRKDPAPLIYISNLKIPFSLSQLGHPKRIKCQPKKV